MPFVVQGFLRRVALGVVLLASISVIRQFLALKWAVRLSREQQEARSYSLWKILKMGTKNGVEQGLPG